MWMAQTCPELGSVEQGIDQCSRRRRQGLPHPRRNDGLPSGEQSIGRSSRPDRKESDRPEWAAGIAGHNPQVFVWAEKNLDVDYYMCSYYNSASRDKKADHVSGMKEWFLNDDRRTMAELIQGLSRPVIHYKVLAAGRNDPADAFNFVARHLRRQDAVCVGIYTKDHPDSMAENIRLLNDGLKALK